MMEDMDDNAILASTEGNEDQEKDTTAKGDNSNSNVNNDGGLKKWLTEVVKLPQYYDIFVDNGLDSMELVSHLDKTQDLEYIGIKQKGHQLVILKCINKLLYNIY